MDLQRVRIALEDAATGSVSAAIHHPVDDPDHVVGVPVLLVPGAGGDLDGDGLTALAEVIASHGHPVVRVNLPHHERGAPAPRAETAVEAFRQIVAGAHEHLGEARAWVLGGKSYGGRVASLAVAEGEPAAGLLFYGYPLHAPGKPERLRVAHWPRVGVRCCFLQGQRDRFCDLRLLEQQVHKLPRRTTLHVVPGADHSLNVAAGHSPSGEARSPRESIAGLGDKLAAWLAHLEE